MVETMKAPPPRCEHFDPYGRRCLYDRHLLGRHKFTLTRAEATIVDDSASDEVRQYAVKEWLREIGSRSTK